MRCGMDPGPCKRPVRDEIHRTKISLILLVFFLGHTLLFSSGDGKKQQDYIFFPAAPATPRIQFLTHFSTSRDVTGRRSWFTRYILGEAEQLPIIKPYGLTVVRGKIYICDSMLGGLEIIDLEKKTFDYFIPPGRGSLQKPINCSLDEEGNLYVADAARNQVVIFNEHLDYTGSFGNPEYFRPTDVQIAGGKIWVCNLLAKQIQVYNPLTHAAELRFPDSEPGQPGYLYSPTNLCLTPEKVYVSDLGDFKIKVYSHDGSYLSSVGSYGRQPGQFFRPKGIALDGQENLYVADAGFENIQIFNPLGQLLMFFGGSYRGPGYMWLPAKVVIDYQNLQYFQKYVDENYNLKYLIYVTNQYGPAKINVYGLIEPK